MTNHHKFLAFAHRLADASAEKIRPLFRAPIAADDKSQPEGYYEPVTQAHEQLGEDYVEQALYGKAGTCKYTSNLRLLVIVLVI